MKYLARLAAFVALALAASGCFNTPPPQTAEPIYPGPDEYAAYGYASDPSLGAYNPFLYAYYWPVPYYYYWRFGGDGDRDCDDGFCGPRRGKKPPHLPLTIGSLPQRLPPRTSAEIAPRTISARSAEPAPSTPSTILNPGISAVNGSHAASIPAAGFHSDGFHSGSFTSSGGFHGSFHR